MNLPDNNYILPRIHNIVIAVLFSGLLLCSIYLAFSFGPSSESLSESSGKSSEKINQTSTDLPGIDIPVSPIAALQNYYYIAVTNFSSPIDNISLDDLRKSLENKDNTSNFRQTYVLNQEAESIASILNIKITDNVTKKSLDVPHADELWLIPFELTNPEYKIITIDGHSLFESTEDWPLIDLSTREANYDEDKKVSLIMTGVTAVSRGVEHEISSRNDPIYPARGVMDVLSKADLTHVNSENAFFDECSPRDEGIILCGRTSSIASLSAIGVDIIGLTGNHQNDYGVEKNLESIQNLTDAGFQYYGGGHNEEEAAKPLYKTVNDTTFAFLGYNFFNSLAGPTSIELAYKDRPGANYYSEEKMRDDIQKAREKADVVSVEFQYIEEYSYNPMPSQVENFRLAIDLGADVVVGVQSHQPQHIEFYQGKPIFHGLGNFFFDQMWSEETREGLIPRFIYYDGKLIAIDVLTTKLYDYSQPRFTSGEERTQLLGKIMPK